MAPQEFLEVQDGLLQLQCPMVDTSVSAKYGS